MQSTTWNIGNIKITQIVELDDAGEIIQSSIPDATPESIKSIKWLSPHFADEHGNLKALVQCFVIETPRNVILVDTCIGNHKERPEISAWGKLQTDFLSVLKKCDYTPDDISIVLCTHLHFDHVGWNTILKDGKWIPTFPHAQYLFSRKEFEYWNTRPEKEIEDDHLGFQDSVMPIYEAGLAKLIEHNERICDGITLLPTPGHTPDHISVLIESGGQRAVITGDAIHHPCQIAHPDWHTAADTYPDIARISRKGLLQRCCNQDITIIGSHFYWPTAGKIKTGAQGNYVFVV